MRKINESILTKLNESDDSHVSLDRLKELREYLNNIISGMEERGMAEAHCDYNMPQGCDCLSIVGKGYIALTSDTDQDYYFEDLMESVDRDFERMVTGVDNDNAEGTFENKLQTFNETIGEWDFLGDPIDPYIASVDISGDKIDIGIEMWDPELDDYVSISAGTYDGSDFIEKLKETDFNKSYDVYEDCRNLVDILYQKVVPNWNKLTKKLYTERDKQLKESCKSKKKIEEDSVGDPNWYCINCGKKKEDYESAYCDSCWEEEADMVDKSTMEEPKREFKSFYELQSYKGPWEEAIVVYTPDSFKQEYTEEERSYKFSHNNRFFQPGKIASSIFGNCLDGKDNGVRLDKYTLYKDQGVKPWKVEKIYITK